MLLKFTVTCVAPVGSNVQLIGLLLRAQMEVTVLSEGSAPFKVHRSTRMVDLSPQPPLVRANTLDPASGPLGNNSKEN